MISGPSSRLATLSQPSKHHLRPFPSASKFLPAVEAYSRPFLPTCDPLPAAKASSQALPLSFQLSPSRRSVFQALSPDLRPSPSCQSIISGPSPQLPTFSQPSKRIPGPFSRPATLSQPSKRDFPAPGAAKSCFERNVPAPPEPCKKPLHDRQYTGQEGPSAFIQRVCYMVLRLRIINPFAPTTGEKHWGHANKEAGTPAISARTEHGKSFPRK